MVTKILYDRSTLKSHLAPPPGPKQLWMDLVGPSAREFICKVLHSPVIRAPHARQGGKVVT